MSNLQPNCCLEFDFRKVDQHAGGKWLIHDTKRRKDNQLQSLKLPCRISKLSSKMWHKGVRWHRIESNILKEGPGTKTSWWNVKLQTCSSSDFFISRRMQQNTHHMHNILTIFSQMYSSAGCQRSSGSSSWQLLANSQRHPNGLHLPVRYGVSWAFWRKKRSQDINSAVLIYACLFFFPGVL